MDLAKMASQLLTNRLGGDANEGEAASALDKLIGSGDNIDLGDFVQKLQDRGGDMANMARSWLGDGENLPISPSQVTELFGGDQIREFASKLGVEAGEASEGLASMIPNLVDKTSSGGSLLDSIGGLGGLKGLASNFLK